MSNFADYDNLEALFGATGTELGKRAKIFTGTKEAWNQLTTEQKVQYTHAAWVGDEQSGAIDDVPTQNSNNLMTSGGIYNALLDKVDKTAIINPNLLDNPWFTVNQRGFTTGVLTASQYTVDRWRVVGPTGQTVTVGNNGVTIDNSNGSNDVYFLQRKIHTELEFAHLLGEKVTGSVLLSNGIILSGTIILSTSNNTYYEDDGIKIYTNVNGNEFFSIQIKAGNSFTIRAVKLEMGDISTLIHEDAPNYTDELLKCQRFFQRLSGNAYYAFALALAINTINADFIVNLPTGMISEPTVSTSGSLMLTDGVTSINLSGISVVNYVKGIASILNMRSTVESGSSLTNGKIYKIAFNSTNAYIDLSAEL